MAWPSNLRSGRKSLPGQLQIPRQDDKRGIGNLQDYRGIRYGQPVKDPLAVGPPVPSKEAILGQYDLSKPGTYPTQKGTYGNTLNLAKNVLGSTTGDEVISHYYGDQYDEMVEKADHHNWMEKVFGGGKRGYIKDRLGQRVEVWRGGEHPTLGTNFGGKAKKSPAEVGAQAYYKPLPNPHGQLKGATYAGGESQNPFRNFLESNNLWLGDPEQADPIKRKTRLGHGYPTDERGRLSWSGDKPLPPFPEGVVPALDRAKAMSGQPPFIRLNRIVDLKGTTAPRPWVSPGSDRRSLEHEIMHHVQAGTRPHSRIGNEEPGTYSLPEIDNNLPEDGKIFAKSPSGVEPGESHMFSNSAEFLQGAGQLKRQWFAWTKAKDAKRRGVPINEGRGRELTPSDVNTMLKGVVGQGVPAHFRMMGDWKGRAGEAPEFIQHFQIFQKNHPKKAEKLKKEFFRIMPTLVDAESPQGAGRKHMLERFRRGPRIPSQMA
jgi:hypothetical protein